jgi:transaldolase
MPADTLRAFADHGEARPTLTGATSDAERVLDEASDAGFDLAATTAELEREGVEAFADSYAEILTAMERELESARSAVAAA